MSQHTEWIDGVKQRIEAATPEPWTAADGSESYDGYFDVTCVEPTNGRVRSLLHLNHNFRVIADRDFIAASRTDLPRAMRLIEAGDRLAEAGVKRRELEADAIAATGNMRDVIRRNLFLAREAEDAALDAYHRAQEEAK